MASEENTQAGPAHLRALAERAARVQDLLGDLELALLPAGETPALRLLGDLKRVWREFRDEALRGAPAAGPEVGPWPR